MKNKTVVLVALLVAAMACSKDKKECYECDFNKNGNYSEAGCMTADEWSKVVITDNLGNGQLDKSRYCRIK